MWQEDRVQNLTLLCSGCCGVKIDRESSLVYLNGQQRKFAAKPDLFHTGSVNYCNYYYSMTSLSDPPCLKEHELYVENAVWILHTLSTRRECSPNERRRPRGEGVL